MTETRKILFTISMGKDSLF